MHIYLTLISELDKTKLFPTYFNLVKSIKQIVTKLLIILTAMF